MEDYMKLQKRKILITEEKPIYLFEQTLFKANGEEGLHLWESSVVFSRYINKNYKIFDNSQIVELGSGCGLLGLACLMYTNCKHLTFSDYQDSVLSNLLTNINLNKLDHSHIIEEDEKFFAELESKYHCVSCLPGRYSICKLDWRDYEKFKYESYDFVIGSELIYSGGHIEELAKLIRNLLKPEGKALITMPEKRSMTTKFIEYLEANELTCKYQYIESEDDDLFGKVLDDEKESKKYFEDLKSMKIILYEIKRVK